MRRAKHNYTQINEFIPALGFNFLTNYYDLAIRILIPRKFRQILVDHICPKSTDKIIDFGCGTGEIAILIKKVSPKTTLIGIDIDPEILKIAFQKIKKIGAEIKLVQSNNNILPLTSNYYDKISSCLVFCNLNDANKMNLLAELYRVLKKGGKIFICDWGYEKIKIKRMLCRTIFRLTPFKKISIKSRTPLLIFLEQSGFINIKEMGFMKTITGTLYYYNAEK